MRSLVLILAAAVAAQPLAAETIAIRGATVIDTAGERDIAGATVVVKDGKIAAVGKDVKVPPSARMIEAHGKYLIPGLIDGHVHFFQSGGLYTRPDAIDLRSEVPYAQEIAAVKRRLPATLSRYTAAGVTGAVDMGGPFWNFEVRDTALLQPGAPRVWVAGPLLSPVQPPELVTEDPPILKTDTAAQASEQARAQVARRPDFLKFWYIVGGEGPAAARPRLTAMLAEARRAGVKAAVHATELETARAAVAEGADVLVHSVDDQEVDDAFVEAVRKRGTVYIPTLIVVGRYGEVYGRRHPFTPAERAGADPEIARSFDGLAKVKLPDWAPKASEQIAALLPRMQRNLMRMYRAGVPIVMGTDAGNIGTPHAVSVPAEMAAMAEAGMPPRAVLASATIAPARMLGVENELGSIESGKIADLVLLREDPRADIRAVAAVELALRAGRVVEAGPASPEALAQRQLEAYNAHDVEAFASAYSDDVAIYDLGPTGEAASLSGVAKLRADYAAFFIKAKPKVEVLQRMVAGPFVVDHERGNFGGKILEAAAIYLVDDGRIRRVWFADGSGRAPEAASIVDRARAAAARGDGAASAAVHAPDHQVRRLTLRGGEAASEPGASAGAPAARILVGAYVIDREAEGTLTVRLIDNGRIRRTWVARG